MSSFTATGVRKRNLDTDRLQNLINADEQGFIQRMKPFNSESPSRGLQIGQGGGQQPNLAADLFTTFGKGINGAIGYVQGAVEVAVGDTIDFFHDATEDIFSSYLKIVNAGVGKVVDIFNGGDFPGQILKLQGDDTDTVTINNANDPGNTTGNVILPGVGASMTLAVEQLTEFVFDPLKNINGHTGAWRLASEATAGGGTLPSGTAVNDHLEWNGVSWDAQQNFEFNATGPFADSGFLRWPNDQIMLSQRNAADDGNLELKIDTSDNFDFTESNNGPVSIQLRSQDGPKTGQIVQFGGATGAMELQTGTDLVFRVGGDGQMNIAPQADTGIEMFDFLDMSGNQVQDLTALVYTGFATDGKSISRFLTASGGINYDLENIGAFHIFRVDGNPPTEKLRVGAASVELSTTLDMNGENLVLDVDADSSFVTSVDDELTLSLQSGANTFVWTADTTLWKFDINSASLEMFNIPVPSAAAANECKIFFDSADEILKVRKSGSTVSLEAAGGSDTPWIVDHEAAGFDLKDISNLEFRVTTGKPPASTSAVYNEAGGMRYNSGVSENHEWSINDSIELTLNGASLDLVGNNILNAQIMQSNATTPADNGTIRLGNAQSIQWRQTGALNATMAFDAFDDFVFNFNALTGDANFLVTALDNVIFRLRSDNNGVGEGTGFLIFEGDNVTPINHEYARIVGIIRANTSGSEAGSLQLGVHDATTGLNAAYLELRGDNGEIDMFRALVMNTRPVIGIDFLALTEKAGDPPVIANEGVLYTKDVGANTRLFYDNSTEAPVELGAGSQTPWTATINADDFSLTNLDILDFNNNTDTVTNSVGQIYYNTATTGMNFNTTTGDDFTWRTNGAIQMKLNVLHLDLGDMGGGGEIECNLYESAADGLVEISMSTAGISYSVNTGDAHTWTVIGGNNMSYSGVNLDLNSSNIVDAGDIDSVSNGTRDFGNNTNRWRILYLQEFTDIEEGFASGVAPVGTTDDAKIFCRPEGTDTELRVKFQTGNSVLLAIEPP